MDQVIFPLAPGVNHSFSLEGGEAAPTAPTLPDVSKLPTAEIDETVLSVAQAADTTNSPSSTPSKADAPVTNTAAAAYGPWSLLSPGQARVRKRSRAPVHSVTPQLRTAPPAAQPKFPRRPPTHKHGRGAGKGRGLHPVSGEPHFVDMHPSWQAIRRANRRQHKAVKRDLSDFPATE